MVPETVQFPSEEEVSKSCITSPIVPVILLKGSLEVVQRAGRIGCVLLHEYSGKMPGNVLHARFR